MRTSRRMLTAVRHAHMLVFGVMWMAALGVLYAGVTGSRGSWVWVAVTLLAIEGTALLANGLTCPLTSLAIRYGADGGHAFDVLLSARFSRVTFRVGGGASMLGVALLAMRWVGVLR